MPHICLNLFFPNTKRKNRSDYDINCIIYVDPPLNLLSFISNINNLEFKKWNDKFDFLSYDIQ